MIDLPPPTHFEKPADIAFVLYSTAEARALRPVIEILHEKGKTTAIIAFGAAKKELSDLSLEKLPAKFDHVGEKGCWAKNDEPALDVVPAKIALIGLGSSFQVDSAKALHNKKISLIGFYDSFESLDRHPFASKALGSLDILLVPTEAQKGVAVGNHEIDTLMKKEKKPCPFPLDPSKSNLLYTGGYGPIYEEGFRLFAKALPALTKKYNVLIALHPASFVTGELERELTSEQPVTIIPKEYPTADLYPHMDRLVTCRSSTLMHALAMGVQSAYLDPAKADFSTIAIKEGWAPLLKSEDELIYWLEKPLDSRPSIREAIPADSARKIAEVILTYLNKTD